MTAHETVIHTPPKTSSDRSFGLVFTAVFVIVGAWPLIHGEELRWWSFGLAAAFLAASFIYPKVLKPLNFVWMKFGMLLNAIVSPLVMGVLFFLVVSPLAFLMRIFKQTPLKLDFDRNENSYWVVRQPPGPEGPTMKNQF